VGKNKLAKFAEMEHFPNVFQPPYDDLMHHGFQLKNNWAAGFWGNDAPVTLELGCGKGEYAVSLAEFFPQRNFIGVDVKGARMFTGARYALEKKLTNVAFVRTRIENIDLIFGRNEISEIWLTFPDPQMKKERKRLTSTWFISRFKKILIPNGIVHLKTDSRFLFSYTYALAHLNNFNILAFSNDLHHSELLNGAEEDSLKITTYYEKQWIERGIPIKYLSFMLNENEVLSEPEGEFEKDSYRSFGRMAVERKVNERLLS
jgi:tRNA (guanine-N7-)-methyltransferase